MPGMVTGAWTALHAKDRAFAGFSSPSLPIADLGSQKVGLDLTFDAPVAVLGK